MFFFAVIGITDEQQTIGQLPHVLCPACGAYTNLQVEKTARVLKLYFLPVWRWQERYLATAPCCGALLEVPPAEGTTLASQGPLRGEQDPSSWRILHSTPRCLCGHPLEADHLYCPHCGRPREER